MIQTIKVIAKSSSSSIISIDEYIPVNIVLGYDTSDNSIYFRHDINDIDNMEDLIIEPFDCSKKHSSLFTAVMNNESYDLIDNPHLYTLTIGKSELDKIICSINQKINNMSFSSVVYCVNHLTPIVVDY
jgi:hypothetical protein